MSVDVGDGLEEDMEELSCAKRGLRRRQVVVVFEVVVVMMGRIKSKKQQ